MTRRRLYWGTVMAESADLPGLWLWAKVRPRPWWFLIRLKLFAQIVWRRWETRRLGIRLAWELSKVTEGLGPTHIHRFHRSTQMEKNP